MHHALALNTVNRRIAARVMRRSNARKGMIGAASRARAKSRNPRRHLPEAMYNIVTNIVQDC